MSVVVVVGVVAGVVAGDAFKTAMKKFKTQRLGEVAQKSSFNISWSVAPMVRLFKK